ncbi:MAG: hypothetical protein JW798_07680 [Prolixibacteraceae bacterium]|nr:hypothetical protein [Prolixibacteraceae bacterium]
MYETEIETGNDEYYNLKYDYLEIMLSDETKLLKFALQPFKPSEDYTFLSLTMQAAYEKKINSSFSIVNEINSNFLIDKETSLHITHYSLGTRWYPGKKKSIETGISGNNCNGYYIGLKASHIFDIAYIREDEKNDLFHFFSFKPTPEISLGIQQRLKKRFYIDVNAFFNYSFFDREFGYGIVGLFGISFNVDD